jgi:putative transposase
MKVNRAVRLELAPNQAQLNQFRQHAGLARYVYNWALQHHRDWWDGNKDKEKEDRDKRPNNVSLSREWTRTIDDHAPWARLLIRSTVTFALKAVDEAYKHAFRRLKEGIPIKKAGMPKMKTRRSPRRFAVQDQAFKYDRKHIRVGKIGMVRVKGTTERLDGARVLRIAVSERAERWFASVMVEREIADPVPKETPILGMDLGLAITLSDGRPELEPPMHLNRMLRTLQRRSRQLSRKRGPSPGRPPSGKWKKAKLALQRFHMRVANARSDWLHKVSLKLSKEAGLLVTEGFDVRGLVSEEVEFRDRRREILDIGWGDLRRLCAYKTDERGATFLQLGKHQITDRTCCECGADNPRTGSHYHCPSCGNRTTRRRNTAKLLAKYGRGECPIPTGGHPERGRRKSSNARGAKGSVADV